MASSSFSATSNPIKPFSHHNSLSSFIKTRHSNLFLTTSCSSLPKRKFSVKNVASNQKRPQLEDPVTDQDTSRNGFVPDSSSIASSIKYHVEFTPSFSPENPDPLKAYIAAAESVRDTLIINWNATYDYYEKMNVKQAYYLSMLFFLFCSPFGLQNVKLGFLVNLVDNEFGFDGRTLLNAIGNLEMTGAYAEALSKLGHNLEDVASQEPDAALGNGGLGRLASCFLDSMATLNYPAWDGQEEVAENWLEIGNPWEIVRNDVFYPVKFFGEVKSGPDGKKEWVGGEEITAVAYDVPIPGFRTQTTLNLRLWSTKVASKDFDLRAFNARDHAKAYEALTNTEKICYILYPGDETVEGKILRLKQQYMLCSASLQDIISCFERRSGKQIVWDTFPEKVAVQMNDTHPTLCIPELIRLLIDEKGLSWKEAWAITQRTVAYTNHTVLPEALEKWSLDLVQHLLPRHVEIIKMIDEELIHTIIAEYGLADLELLQEKLRQMRILNNLELPASVVELLHGSEELESPPIEPVKEIESPDEESKPVDEEDQSEEEEIEKMVKVTFEPGPKLPKLVRMANLCVVGGHAVNGVAEIHSEIVKEEVFNGFYKLWPEKFQNKTNGVTPRRWIRFCNPDLSRIITEWTGTEDWVVNTEKLVELRKFADNEDLQFEWREAKRINKMRVASFLKEKTGYIVSPDAMFDVQVKRIHEYKRQLLNILGVVYRYKMMKEMSPEERNVKYVPRVCIFGGKAFATYVQAKRIVKFITDVGTTVNYDAEIGDLLKVVFVPDYNVSVAEVLIPGSELSQHISTAGMEASGTSNMKFAMNGCILIGTLDGANVEIRQEVGDDNFFLFGAHAHEISGLRKERAEGQFVPDPRFEEVKAFVRSGVFGPYNYEELMGSLEGNEGYGRADYFLVGNDFPSYIECQEMVDEAYQDQKKWTRMSILNTAGSYKFSSDRTIHEYARDIWRIDPVQLACNY
ncbi:Glycosyl transferase, family 35 [Dillenia turbinata]|uniref:Alpha-1,4 glucan phosphorylase n=1 Tax=Dillenia turbinata TaxID=194707 RepID=A0AAN8URQ4_9MAGN